MGKYFGTDGFRGEAGITLTADHAYKVGRFLGWYYKVVVPSAHTAENYDFISSDQGSRSSTSKSLFRSARSGSMLSR